MTSKEIVNFSASIRAKLKNIAVSEQKEFQYILRQFFWERFLYRISVSGYRDNFILKGALMMVVLNHERNRPTRDMDFLGVSIPNDMGQIAKVVSEIAKIEASDGVCFLSDTIESERINDKDAYSGVRIKITGVLGVIRQRVFIDIGFGDSIADGGILSSFPVLLPLSVPQVYIYPIESSVSEKFEALVSLQLVSSRMKDIFDILYYQNSFSFAGKKLKKAIIETFNTRGTDREKRRDVFSSLFKENKEKQIQWQAFHKTNKLTYTISFSEAMLIIEKFLEPVISGGVKTWNPTNLQWEDKQSVG